MDSHSLLNKRMVASTLCVLGLASVGAFRAHADEWDKKTILTVNQPIQVQERVLQPGQYVFKLLNSTSDRHVVQIFNADQSHIIDTVIAIPNYRLQPTGRSQFMFWETPPGTAKALRAWFYPGDNFGQEFRYPKHLQRLEAMASTATVAVAAPPTTVMTQQETAQQDTAQQEETKSAEITTQAQTQDMKTEEPQANREEQPVEMAQAAPPPPPPTQEPVQQQPTRLPKTASPYPLIGLAGMLSLSLFGVLRLKRSA